MRNIEITAALLDDIEAKAKAATQGQWRKNKDCGAWCLLREARLQVEKEMEENQ